MTPLAGLRVVLTASRATELEVRIRALGGDPLIAPAIAIAPIASWSAVDDALRRVGRYDWITFTSANAVRAVAERAETIGIAHADLCERRLAAVGPATAAAVATAMRPPDVVARVHTASALAAEMPNVSGQHVLFPRGDLAGTDLADGLRARGAAVDDVIVYRTVPGPGIDAIVAAVRDRAVDVLVFASASAVRFVAEAIQLPPWLAVLCIGPVTAEAARVAGFHTVEEMV